MIKAFFCDIGNVLIYFNSQLMFQEISLQTQLSKDILENIFFSQGLHVALETGILTSQDLFTKFKDYTSRKILPKHLDKVFDQCFIANKEFFELIVDLKRQKIKLIILSNTSALHFEYLIKKFPILKLFDEWILSYEVKAMKPSKEIYQAAIRASESEANECFYVDDLIENVEAATVLGIHSFVYENVVQIRSELNKLGLETF